MRFIIISLLLCLNINLVNCQSLSCADQFDKQFNICVRQYCGNNPDNPKCRCPDQYEACSRNCPPS